MQPRGTRPISDRRLASSGLSPWAGLPASTHSVWKALPPTAAELAGRTLCITFSSLSALLQHAALLSVSLLC